MLTARFFALQGEFRGMAWELCTIFCSQMKKLGTACRGQIVERVKLRLNQLELLSIVECVTALAAAASLEELTSQQV